jgi:hypothetical protein
MSKVQQMDVVGYHRPWDRHIDCIAQPGDSLIHCVRYTSNTYVRVTDGSSPICSSASAGTTK